MLVVTQRRKDAGRNMGGKKMLGKRIAGKGMIVRGAWFLVLGALCLVRCAWFVVRGDLGSWCVVTLVRNLWAIPCLFVSPWPQDL